jgi:hypothetical protein
MAKFCIREVLSSILCRTPAILISRLKLVRIVFSIRHSSNIRPLDTLATDSGVKYPSQRNNTTKFLSVHYPKLSSYFVSLTYYFLSILFPNAFKLYPSAR